LENNIELYNNHLIFAEKTMLEDGFYNVTLSCNIPEYADLIMPQLKTFFPAHWPRKKVVEFCLELMPHATEIYQNPKMVIFENNIKGNLVLRYVYNKEKKWFSAIFPTNERLNI
jgi:hypothetical protein